MHAPTRRALSAAILFALLGIALTSNEPYHHEAKEPVTAEAQYAIGLFTATSEVNGETVLGPTTQVFGDPVPFTMSVSNIGCRNIWRFEPDEIESSFLTNQFGLPLRTENPAAGAVRPWNYAEWLVETQAAIDALERQREGKREEQERAA